jgi:photosystem II stability/assembly factor-like uncharacterized protein
MIKSTFFTSSLAILLSASALVAQKQQEKTTAPNFYRIQEKANIWFGQHPAAADEEDGTYAQYKRWEWFNEQRVLPNGNFPSPAINWQEWKSYARSHSGVLARTAYLSGNWSFIGPTTTPGGYEGLGRVSCIAFHPTIANTFWVGTPAGGLWKTTNAGATWSTATDNTLPVMGVSDIAIDPTNANIMYIATGDADFGSLSALTGGYWGDTKSVGVLKSTDGGATWNTTGLSFTVPITRLIRRLLISPLNHKVLIAASSDGVYRTNDAGATWTNIQSGHFIDLAFKPGDASVVYASTWDNTGNAQVYTSTDTANSFVQASTFTGVGRIALGTTPAAPNVVHALCSDASTLGFAGLYASRNSGASFDVLYPAGTINMLNNSFDGSGTNGQGNYDLTYLMSPTDTVNLYVGGVNTWKSSDAGATWSLNTMWTGYSGQNPNGVIAVHADKHFMANDPHNPGTVYQTNDGGIYQTTDGGVTWTDLSNGLGISQIYRIGTSATNPNINMTGLQDNGSRKFDAGTWSYATGGDGCECIIDYQNPQNMYGSYVQGRIYATTDAWATTTTTISNNIPGTPTGSWVTPYVMDPVSPATLYAGYADVYKTTNRGSSWTAISSGLTGSTSKTLKTLAVAPSDNQTIYAATFDSLYITRDGGSTWKSISKFSPGNRMTYIAIHPSNPLTAWVTISRYAAGKKVYKTIDGGATWTNVSGTLPNVPANTIVYEKGSNDGLYVGTDVGVFYTNASMSDWIPFSTGLPNVIVTELEIQYSSGELRAGTFGRGLWKSNLYSLSTGMSVSNAKENAVQVFPNPTKGAFTLSIPGFKGTDKANLYNYLGETLQVIDVRNANMQLDLGAYAEGIYYIGLESEHYSHMYRVLKVD